MLPETPEMAVYKHNDCNMSAGLLDCGKGMQGKAGREGDLFWQRRRMFSRTTVLYFDNGFLKRGHVPMSNYAPAFCQGPFRAKKLLENMQTRLSDRCVVTKAKQLQDTLQEK